MNSAHSQDNLPHRHDALSGSEFTPEIESTDPDRELWPRERIIQKLSAHPSLDITDVQLFMKNGYVSINGHVHHSGEKENIEKIISEFGEVIDVVNFLKIRDAHQD